MPMITRLIALALLLSAPAVAQAQRTLALVIGINDYDYVQKLDGARADAVDITQALEKAGVSRVITLLDHDATKANVTEAWQTLLDDAGQGDLIMVSYAGHGAQTRELTAGQEADAKDEFWVLTGFNPDRIRETWRESVFDNELHEWMEQAHQRGVRVVLVSDSCHAGGMDRAVRTKLRYIDVTKNRLLSELFARVVGSGGSSDPGATQEAVTTQDSEPVLPDNVTMLAATPESQPVPEVIINGQARGALSWSVARALEGAADADGDGTVTRNELENYVMANVRMRSEALQVPVFAPVAARSADEALFSVGEAVAMASPSVGQGGNRPEPMARELGFKPVLPLIVTGADIKVEDTVNAPNAYVWNAQKGVFSTPNGEIAAEQVSAFTVNDVVGKYILLDFLKTVASQNPGRIELSPEKSLYHAGERIKFNTAQGRYRNMIVFNLANSGEVQYLDMIINGEPTQRNFLKEMQVVAPLGADHLITIASDQPLEPVGRVIERGVSPKDLLKILTSRLDGEDMAVAVMPIYTRAN